MGGGDVNLCAINDTVINSRLNPTLVASVINPTFGGEANANSYDSRQGGIAILNAVTGAYVATNLDYTNWYTSAAFDNVGNVYACSTTTNYWRVWSPPGANTNTTTAAENIVVSAPLTITKITSVPTGSPGCATVTIAFSGPSLASTAFNVYESSSVNGTYTPVAGAVITGSSGSYQAVFSNCSTEFYVIKQ